MPGVQFGVEVIPPVQTIKAAFAVAALEFKSFRVPLQMAVRNVLAPRIYQNFDDGGIRGDYWQPLELSTIAYKITHGYSRHAVEPLLRTGNLQKRAGQVNNWHVTSESAAFENIPDSASYGIFHQFGFTHYRTGVAVPARPWVAIDESDMARIETIFEIWIAARLGTN